MSRRMRRPRSGRQSAAVGARAETAASGAPAPERRGLLYYHIYPWFLLFASLDIMITWVILHLEGRELNMIADWVIQRFDLIGVVLYKFGLFLFVVAVCEVIGRRRPGLGEKLARWAVVVTAFPVVVGILALLGAT